MSELSGSITDPRQKQAELQGVHNNIRQKDDDCDSSHQISTDRPSEDIALNSYQEYYSIQSRYMKQGDKSAPQLPQPTEPTHRTSNHPPSSSNYNSEMNCGSSTKQVGTFEELKQKYLRAADVAGDPYRHEYAQVNHKERHTDPQQRGQISIREAPDIGRFR